MILAALDPCNATAAQACLDISPPGINLTCSVDTPAVREFGVPLTYTCECPSGFNKVLVNVTDDQNPGGVLYPDCLEINECADPLLNTCTDITTSTAGSTDGTQAPLAYPAACINLFGSYQCVCPPCYAPSATDPVSGVVYKCDPIPACDWSGTFANGTAYSISSPYSIAVDNTIILP